jgi:molybdenum cofactor cytidylyltransferase
MHPSRTVAVVLAAGLSTRFGGDKLLHPLAGKPLAAYIADTLAGMALAQRLAVCPEGNAGRAAIFAERDFDIVLNTSPRRGLASSLALGARRALDLGADGMLVCLADMPYVSAEFLQRLVSLVDSSAGTAIAASLSGGVKSPPAAFAASALPELLALEGDKGAHELLKNARDLAAPEGMLADFDTRADFE